MSPSLAPPAPHSLTADHFGACPEQARAINMLMFVTVRSLSQLVDVCGCVTQPNYILMPRQLALFIPDLKDELLFLFP